MRIAVLAVLAALAFAWPAWGEGFGTEVRTLPVHAYGGLLKPSEVDPFPRPDLTSALCTSGSAVVGSGVMVHLLAPDLQPGDVLLLHTFQHRAPWAAVTTMVAGSPGMAAVPTADFTSGCPFFAVELAEGMDAVTYVVLTCGLLGPCPPLWD